MVKIELNLKMGEIDARYKGESVLVGLTKIDESRQPLEGYVIVHGRRKRVYNKLQRLLVAGMETGQKPDLPYFIFRAGSTVPLNKL